MWRQNVRSENADSDHSFSVSLDEQEEDDFDGDFSANCVSLSGHAEKEEGVNILSQLEKLQDASGLPSSGNCYPSIEAENNAILSEDEVEAPDFEKERSFMCSSESKFMHKVEDEIISDEEDITDVSCRSYGCGRKDQAHTFSLQNSEGATLMKGNGHASYSSHTFVPSRSKFSEGSYCLNTSLCPKGKHERTDALVSKGNVDLLGNPSEPLQQSKEYECRTGEYVAAEHPRHFNEEIETELDIMPRIAGVHDHQSTENSMAELLDSLQDKTISLEENCKMIGGDDVELAVAESKGQTIADRFQEILDTTLIDGGAFVSVSKSSSFGLFERLQKIMRSEKEKEIEFLKMLPNGISPSCRTSSIDVIILSRHLDAKLTVCHCSSEKNSKESYHDTSSGRRTVIFNPKVCNNVDLEIGSKIRIYSPWMEVQVSGYSETILLSTYYSQVSA